eukprot:m.167784 g.167784  ORF g.167784 m.167784 type:complete len:605 (-) comp12876_c0_seq1:201-2015(-)
MPSQHDDTASIVETALVLLFSGIDATRDNDGRVASDGQPDRVDTMLKCIQVADQVSDTEHHTPEHKPSSGKYAGMTALDATHALPPAWMVAAVACNQVGEIYLDQGDTCNARVWFGHAVHRWHGYAEPQLSVAQLDRESGHFASALACFQAVRTLPEPDSTACAMDEDSDVNVDGQHVVDHRDNGPGGAMKWNWYSEWVVEPLARCRSVAAYHEAHLLSRLGRHAEAAPLLCRLGATFRISPNVWEMSHTPAAPKAASVCDELGEPGRDGDGPRFFRGAVPPHLGNALRCGFAPDMPYWTETQYDSREYFSWWYDVSAPPLTVVDQLIRHLLPLTGLSDVVGAEWWVHSRPLVADFGHQLHFDMEEHTLETTGRVVHPAISSVVYLDTGGRQAGARGVGQTLVLDQTFTSDTFSERGWLVRPVQDAFMTFPGELLHGVVPGAPPPASSRNGKRKQDGRDTSQDGRRLTLMIGWWTGARRIDRGRRRRGPGPACSVPRLSSTVSWPASLPPVPLLQDMARRAPEPPEHDTEEDVALAMRETTAHGVDVTPVSPVWEALTCANVVPDLTIPPSIDQRFFVRAPTDFADAVQREHFPEGAPCLDAGV